MSSGNSVLGDKPSRLAIQGAVFRIEPVVRIADIDASEWDACTADGNPFLTHAYLAACEASGLAAPANRWQPILLTVRDPMGHLAAATAIYAKSTSEDEYWIDQNWAASYEAAGGRYYPKFVIGVPFAPVVGRRFLLRSDMAPEIAKTIIRHVETQARLVGVSSIHVTFPDEIDRSNLEEAGWFIRHDLQYEWQNRGYRDFLDFLDGLTSRARHRIRRERRIVAQSGIRFRDVPGTKAGDLDVGIFIDLLNDLHRRRGTRQPLTAEFIRRMTTSLGDRVTLSFAEQDGQAVAAILYVTGPRRIYVRNWGCRAGQRFVHFECCYYRTIERAIELGCDAVEGGYGGEHKLARGFLPKLVHAAHWFGHEGLHRAVCQAEQPRNDEALARFNQALAHSPFHKGAFGTAR